MLEDTNSLDGAHLIDDIFCNAANANCFPLPDQLLWSEEAKLGYQEAFHTPEVKK